MFKRQQIARPGRITVTIECADDLTDDEIIQMEAAIEAQICVLQKHRRDYTPEHVAGYLEAA
jgi:hypothetical protein